MYRLVLLLVPLLALCVPVGLRLWQTPTAWWNWLALGLLISGVACVYFAWNQRNIERKPKWYSLRPGIIAGACVVLLVAWFAIRLPAPMGDGPAGPDVAAQAFSKTWSDRPIVLLSLGDSVSTGYGAPPGHGYFDLIRDNATVTYPEMHGLDLAHVLPNIRVIRRASNSSNSEQHLRDIQTLPTFSPNTFGIVCITTGGIDLIHMYGKAAPREGALYGATAEQAGPWIQNYRTRLNSMMQTLHDKFPGGCAVMLATIYEPTDDVGDIENAGPIFWLPEWEDGRPIHGAFNEALRDCAATHDFVHLVDVHRVMLGHGIHCQDRTNEFYDADDPTYWFYVNLEDPNRRGYDAIRRVFLNAIVDALDANPGFDVPPVSGP